MATHTQVVEKKARKRDSFNKVAIKTRTSHAIHRPIATGSHADHSDFHHRDNGANAINTTQKVPAIEVRQSMHGMCVSEEEYWAYMLRQMGIEL